MTIQPIGAGSAVLYITAADLKERGLTPAQLTLEGGAGAGPRRLCPVRHASGGSH